MSFFLKSESVNSLKNSCLNNQLNNTGGGETNITIVNQTTGRIDKVEKQQISRSDVVLIIQETVPTEIANPNSRTSKALKNNTNSQRRLT